MQPKASTTWSPPGNWQTITVVDAHTGGEPFRVVVDGIPDIPGATMLERRRFAIENLDHLRRLLMWEPRGHADMYGGWIGPPVRDDSDLSVLFLHNEGFSTMCGHGVIALTKVVLDTGIVEPADHLKIDTPAGQVVATPRYEEGLVAEVSFINVESFVAELDALAVVPGVGQVRYDLAFGGAFYAYVAAGEVGVSLDDISGLIETGGKIKRAIAGDRSISHPDHPDLGFLYGVIFTGPAVELPNHSRNVCVFADGEVDRSPTGTGVSGRLAILHARGEIGVDDPVGIESIVGSVFTGRVASITTLGVVPEVTGTAHILGRSEYWIDPTDRLGQGFLLN